MKWILVFAVVLTASFGDVCKAKGMRKQGEIDDFRPGALRNVFRSLARNKYVILSIAAMAVSFFAFLKLLSIAPLSFAVPATAANIIVETILARWILREAVDWRRWAGVGLIMGGVVLLAQ